MKLFPRGFFEGEGAVAGGGGTAFTPSFEGAVGADGAFSEGWTAKAFGADYKGPLAGAKNISDVNKMLTDSMTAARAKTDGMIRIPGAEAKPEEWAAYHKAIGVPDNESEYSYKLPEGLKEEQISKPIIDGWRKEFKALGIPKATAEKLINKQLTDEAAGLKARHEAFNKGLEEEKAALATRFPKINETISLVNSLATRNGVPDSLKAAIADGAFDPTKTDKFWGANALEAFAWAAKATGEDRGGGAGGGAASGENAAWGKAVMSDKTHPLYAQYHAGDAAVLARVTAAYKVP